MKKQSRTTSYFKKIFLAIAVTFCWVTVASANLITYDLTIRYTYGSEDIIFTGVAELDTDTHVIPPYIGYDDITHIYSLSYEIESTDGQSGYSGEGSLYLAHFADLHVYLDGFADYYQEEQSHVSYDPEPTSWIWHDPDFDVMSITSMNVVDYFGSYDDRSTTLDLVQVSRVPEPSVLLLMASGLIGLGFVRRKKILKA